jgi:hypothetical protein
MGGHSVRRHRRPAGHRLNNHDVSYPLFILLKSFLATFFLIKQKKFQSCSHSHDENLA